MNLTTTVAAALVVAMVAAPAGAQQATGSIVTGVVLDAGSQAPVPGVFVSVVGESPRAITDQAGRFRLANVPAGPQRIIAERFGYREGALDVEVSDSLGLVEIVVEPMPVQLDELVVTAQGRGPLIGVVTDATSGEPVPWVTLSLSRNFVRREALSATDEQGVFRIGDVESGGYALRVEKLGYEAQYVLVDHLLPPEPLDIRLEPDSLILAGLEAINAQLTRRRAASPSIVRSLGEEQLQMSATRNMRTFIQDEAGLSVFPCSERDPQPDCISVRGRASTPRVYIDEMQIFGGGMTYLASFQPQEFHTVDIFTCGPGDRLGGWEIRAYTIAYMESVARRPQNLIPSCF